MEKPGLEETIEEAELPPFEPGLPPSNIHNTEAARARQLKYDPKSKVYRDAEGCPVKDKYGQPLG